MLMTNILKLLIESFSNTKKINYFDADVQNDINSLNVERYITTEALSLQPVISKIENSSAWFNVHNKAKPSANPMSVKVPGKGLLSHPP